MKKPLSEAIISPQDLTAAMLEVREYARWFNQATIRQKLKAGEPVDPPGASPAVVDLLKAWAADKPLDAKRLDDLLDELADWQDRAPHVKLTLAAPAPTPVRRDLAAWCRTNIDPEALLSFNFNATLLGGMVISCGSHIFDWSFRRQILESRGKFPEVLRRV